MNNRKTALGILILTSVLTMSLRINAQSVKIGNQEWMTKNLNVSTFGNGDPIQEAKTAEEWKKAGDNEQPAWCHYENDLKNGKKYGKLYNWYAVNDPRGLAPAGWYVPSNEEWTTLTDFLGVDGTKMESTYYREENVNSTNESGFSGIPGGFRSSNGNFYSIGEYSFWWSSTETYGDFALYRSLTYHQWPCHYGRVGSSNFKDFGFSVRCLRD